MLSLDAADKYGNPERDSIGYPRMPNSDEEATRCARHLIEAMQNLRRVLERREENIRRSPRIRLTAEDEYRAVFKDTLITEDREI